MKHKTNLVFWFYIVTILTFNDFTGLYVSKMSLRVMYISLIAIWLFLSFFSSDGKMSLTKSGTVVSGYTVYVAFRFVFQLVSDEKVTGVTIISFAQLFLPIIGFFMAQKLDSHDRKRIERHFCLCTVVSVLMGFIDSAVHFLPKQELYAYVSDGNVVLRGYSMAGSALITGFICALSASFVLGSKKNVVQKKYLYISMFAISILGLLKSYSRGAMAFFLVVCVANLYMRLWNEDWKIKIKGKTLLSIIMMIALLSILMVFNWRIIAQNSVFQRFVRIGINPHERSNYARTTWQIQALTKFIENLENLLLGRGFGFTGYQAALSHTDGYINTESYMISLLINIGLIGFLMFVLIIFHVLKKQSKLDKCADFRYVSIVLGIVVWSVMYIVLDSDLNGFLFWYCVAQVNRHRDGSYGMAENLRWMSRR